MAHICPSSRGRMTTLHIEQVQESTGLVQPKMQALVRQVLSPPVQNQRVAYVY